MDNGIMQQGNAVLSVGMWWEKPAANDGCVSGREDYNYFRYYDPSTGRYITSDPIGLAGGWNTYTYVENNPLGYIDLVGLMSARPTVIRPMGVPRNWISKPTKKGGGDQYINPKNTHERVRHMPGNPKSPNPAQQKPYVKHMKDGKALDKNGNPVEPNSPEAHIPLENFKFPKDPNVIILDELPLPHPEFPPDHPANCPV